MNEHRSATHDTATLDGQLAKILAEYLEALRDGKAPSKSDIIRQHPDLAEDLSTCLASLDFVQMAGIKSNGGDVADECPSEIGDFKIVREIGRGGMGVVYEAVQPSLDRRVALKVLPLASILDDRQKARFQNEARAVGLLTHDNIVPIYQVGVDRGIHFYAMQFVDGRTLADLIRELWELKQVSGITVNRNSQGENRSTVKLSHPSERTDASNDGARLRKVIFASTSSRDIHRSPEFFRAVAKIGIQAASALQHAHESGVVHRDIKPTNLLIDGSAKIWVADFGLALIEADAGLTFTGDVLGTARYMSPEQATGTTIDHRTDIFSLGMTLYELVTLQHASPGNDRLQIIRQICEVEPKSPRFHNDRIPHELETILLKSLEKDPAERYQSAGGLEADLQRYLDNRPILASRPTFIHRANKWTRRNRAVFMTALVSIFFLLATVAAVSLFALNRLAKSEQLSEHRLYDSLLQKADAIRGSLDPNRRSKSIRATNDAVQLMARLGIEDDRAEKLRVRNSLIAGLSVPFDVRNAAEWKQPNYISAFDANLEEYASYEKDDSGVAQIVVRKTSDQSEVDRLPHSETEEEFRDLSPNGRFVTYAARGKNTGTNWMFRVWDRITSRRVVDEVPSDETWGHRVRFSMGGARIWFRISSNQVRAYDLPSGKIYATFDLREFDANEPGWWFDISPDDQYMAVCHGYDASIISLTSNKVVQVLRHDFPVYHAVNWSNDGRYLATITNDRTGHIWDLRNQRRVQMLSGSFVKGDILFNSASTIVATQRRGNHTVIWDTMSGRELFSMPGRYLKFGASGNQLAWNTDHKLGVWEITPSPAFKRFQAIGAYETASVCSVGDSLIAAGSEDGVRIWCRHTGKLLAHVHSLGRTSVIFHKESQMLISNGRTGVIQWPYRENGSEVVVGPPKYLYRGQTSGYFDIAQSPDGSQFLANVNGRLVFYDMTADQPVALLEAPISFRWLSISPGNQLAASGIWHNSTQPNGVLIWDLESRKVLTQITKSNDASGRFSPDGLTLVVSTGTEYGGYESNGWKKMWSIPRRGISSAPGPIAFSADSEIVTVRTDERSIKLVRVSTGEIIAELEDPYLLPSVYAEFSDDGRCLLEPVFNMVRMWDIAEIRERLAEAGLDWEGPSFPTHTEEIKLITSVKIISEDASESNTIE